MQIQQLYVSQLLMRRGNTWECGEPQLKGRQVQSLRISDNHMRRLANLGNSSNFPLTMPIQITDKVI